MKMDDVRRYIDLRDSLRREKSELEERLRQLNEALGETTGMIESGGDEGDSGAAKTATASSGRGAATSAAPSQGAGRGGRRGRRPSSGLSLRDAVLEVTGGGPKTKDEILDGIKKLGYKFSTSNPKNSLGVILYGKNPRFKNEDGKFSPVGGAGAASGGSRGAAKNSSGSASTSPGAGAFSRKKRQLSPEARERIAAAQRARWAKRKSGGK
jgi:hypothetical protein